MNSTIIFLRGSFNEKFIVVLQASIKRVQTARMELRYTLVRLDLFRRLTTRTKEQRAKTRTRRVRCGRGEVDGDGVRRGGVRRSARTTRSICMLGDVDHVGRGWPAAPGCWLASGHPNATPTPTHAVLSSPRAIQPPCTSTVVPPQLEGQGVTRGCGSHNSGQRDSTYYPLTLLPNSVE